MDHDYLPSPEIRFYKRLKSFFRKFETEFSLKRIEFTRDVIEYLYQDGDLVGFDILGSINFGMSHQESDLDLVVYYESPALSGLEARRYAKTLQKKVLEYQSQNKTGLNDYKVQFVDYINLKNVELSILTENPYCSELQSFLLYRTICRGIHYRIVRPYERMLLERPHLMMYLEDAVKDSFREIITNPTSRFSFTKYKERLEYDGKRIPNDIKEMLNFYLDGKLDELLLKDQ